MYKLRFYKKSGPDKGILDHEEFFDTQELARARFVKVFVPDDYSLNPTLWEKHGDEWIRVKM